MADHAQTPVHRELPIAAELGRRWSILQPSADRPEEAELAVSPTSRAANVYLLAGERERPELTEVRGALEAMEGVDLVAHLACDGASIVRESPAPPPPGAEAVVRRAGVELRFRPGDRVADLRGGRWELSGEPLALDLEEDDGRLRSESYPDALARLWSALAAPHCGDLVISATLGYECVDWGAASHVGGGSHGSLHRGDSLGPLLFCGCGPKSADEREQWALRDVASIVVEHFGDRERAARGRGLGGSGRGGAGMSPKAKRWLAALALAVALACRRSGPRRRWRPPGRRRFPRRPR